MNKLRAIPGIADLTADTRHAVRRFRRNPLSTTTMIMVLSLGIGTNVLLFTVLNSLATLPAPGIERDGDLVRLRGTSSLKGMAGEQQRLMSWPEVQEYAARTELFSSVAAFANETAIVTTDHAESAPITTNVIYATSNYFNLLNVRAALGNEPASDASIMQLTTSPGAMISNAMWHQAFGGAPNVIGRILRFNDVPVHIVGVAPPRFLGTGGAGVRGGMTIWLPLAAYPLMQKRAASVFINADSMFLTAVARRRVGVTTTSATPIVESIASRLVRSAPDRTSSADIVPMLASNSRVSQRGDLILSGATSAGLALLVLLITCTTVSALLVGLAVARRREIGVRLSLGAPRARLIQQLLTESVLLALIAATAGLYVTAVGIRLIGARLEDVQLVVDWRVTIVTCLVAVVTGLLFGISPALHATRVSVAEILKSSASSVAATRSRLQRGLVVAQIAFTQPLLFGLGVIVTTLAMDLDSQATSRAPERIVEIEVDPWAARVTNAERARRIASIVDRVGALPGVIAALPLEEGTVTAPFSVPAADRIAGISYEPVMQTRLVAAPKGYFKTFDIPIVRGRDFNTAEYAHSSGEEALAAPAFDAVIIGSDVARRLWGAANPIGRRLALGSSGASASAMVIVGVVDATATGPSDVNHRLRVYVPYATMNTGVIARSAGPALPLLNAMRKVVATEAPQMPISRAQTIEQRESEARRSLLRTSSAVAGGGLLALLLSALGLYAVVSLAVGQRTREIGIRTALGARPGQVVRMFFARGLALSAVGIVVGLPLSVLATRFIATTLNWPVASPPLLGIAIGAVVLVVGSVAAWIPARRASTIDPMVALRTE